MAADTRPYKSKEQDGQGNEVIIRDQQLVEQSTVTTMPSGACFETLDIDGRPVKIPRDSMMSIVLECIGIVLNDSSKNLGTNVNKALGLQGNTIGNVTVNDFASVLGVAWESSTIPAKSTITIPLNTNSIIEIIAFGEQYAKYSFNWNNGNPSCELIDSTNNFSTLITVSASVNGLSLTSLINYTTGIKTRIIG